MVTSAEVAFDGGRGGQAALVWAASSVADRPATVITVEEADDLGVRIPEGLVVGDDPELDARRFRRTENGVCLITKPMIARLEA